MLLIFTSTTSFTFLDPALTREKYIFISLTRGSFFSVSLLSKVIQMNQLDATMIY